MEKSEYTKTYDAEKQEATVDVTEVNVEHGESFLQGDSLYAKIQRKANKFGAEARGIERVPEDERTDKNTWKIGSMWLAANMNISSFALGMLAVPIFGLGFVDALLTLLFFNLLGVLSVCFFSTFGPVFGMRQMILSRYWFGYYGTKLIATFNSMACLGWSAVNAIVGAQLLHAVNPDLPGWVGVIIMGVGTFIVTLFGYKVVHLYEMVSWIPCFIVFLIIAGEFGKTGKFTNIPMGAGKAEIGSVFSFGAAIFGFATGWTGMAADYTCYQPRNASRVKIFLWVFAGLMCPLLFCEILGLAIATATVSDAGFETAYKTGSVGGILGHILVPSLGKFGQFCLVILSLSTVGGNCPNIYTLSLSLQVLTEKARLVPRVIWIIIGTIIYCAIAVPGYSRFESILENLMLIIAYWLAIYEGISLPEHFIFRRGISGYDVAAYNVPSKLPVSLAALGAFCFGILGAAMGMSQLWYTGPIGKLCGAEFGGDIGFELAFAFAFVTYVPLRTWERRQFGR